MTRLIDLHTPFVLLDDARASGASSARLYADPVEIVTTRRPVEVRAALDALRVAARGGLHAAGWIGYEAGAALEPALATRDADRPLLWFGLFRDWLDIPAHLVPTLLPDSAGAWVGKPRPAIAQPDYAASFDAAQVLIAAGDIYQVNLTFPAEVALAGHPLAAYAGLRARAEAGFGAVVRTGEAWLLSLSPELFFTLADGTITCRPMKGTAPRDPDAAADRAAAAALAHDPKQRAENLMIVDLVRNDISRVARAGSVAVPALFEVESYPTVHHLTSTVTAALADGRDAIDVLAALFPCGSITGAPKIRAMQVLGALEPATRDVYTGSIGRIDAGGTQAAFNVAIRTLAVAPDGASARLGLGSGLVADSDGAEEWAECLAKGAFVASSRGFDLVETMAFDPRTGVARLDRHLARMQASAGAFGFICDAHRARNELQSATFRLRTPSRLRLVLGRAGHFAVESRPLPPPPAGPVDVALVPLPVDAQDFRLRHKTTDRAFYDTSRGDAWEVAYTRPDGTLTEGSFTNLFVPRDGMLLTPPCDLGLLGGVLRAVMLDRGEAIEAVLTAADLANGFLIGNSLRGLLPARLSAV